MSQSNQALVEKTEHGVRFAVDDVTPGRTVLHRTSCRKMWQATLGRDPCAVSDEKSALLGLPSRNDGNGLLDAVHKAFSNHQHLMLDPDSIWLTIAQGFAHHVNSNAEELRARFVEHEDKFELIVPLDTFDTQSQDDWANLVDKFATLISEHTKAPTRSWLECDFSTTTPAACTASQIVMMDAFQSYFDYTGMCICGIPSVTLRGSTDDWRKIAARLDAMQGLGLDWWIERLRPIVDQFVAAAEGRPDRAFWQDIIKPKEIYAATLVNGWIVDLFPYVKNFASESAARVLRATGDASDFFERACKVRRNPLLATPRSDWSAEDGISTVCFPNGRSSAPVTLKNARGAVLGEFEVFAGILGFERISDALSPVISWAVAEQAV